MERFSPEELYALRNHVPIGYLIEKLMVATYTQSCSMMVPRCTSANVPLAMLQYQQNNICSLLELDDSIRSILAAIVDRMTSLRFYT